MKLIAATLAILSFTAFAYSSGAESAETTVRQVNRIHAIETAVEAATK